MTRRWQRGWIKLVLGLLAVWASSAEAMPEATWNDYLDHAYVFAAADEDDLRGLLDRTTLTVGRSLAEYHAETFPALAARRAAMTEVQLRRKAIAELLHKPLYSVSMGELGTTPESLEANLQVAYFLLLPPYL